MKQDINVDSGEVAVAAKGETILRANAIGSCVVVAAYNLDINAGGMAHVMLPGISPSGGANKTRYAANAMEELMSRLDEMGAVGKPLLVCLVGGANLLGDSYNSPGPEIVTSLKCILADRGISPEAVHVGGTDRRSCTLDVANGRVVYTVGDSGPQVLWEVEKEGP